MNRVWFFPVTVFLLLTGTGTAHAYLDAGTGSIVMQLILGGLAGLAVVVKLFWHKILGFFGINKKNNVDTNSR